MSIDTTHPVSEISAIQGSGSLPATGPVAWERIEALLHRVIKPGRYVGGEYNSVQKAWDATDLHICLAFPDLYDLGMSNFALMILYDVLNRQPDLLAHRTYLPAPDMIAAMREAGLPLYALESYQPVSTFDILAISTAYEQLYTNSLELMDLAGIPLRSANRDVTAPLVIGGGHGTFNPEPIADFFDVFVIGEAEDVILELVGTFQRTRQTSRDEQLRALAQIPGLYVPQFYTPAYAVGGGVLDLTVADPSLPTTIKKRLMPTLPATPVAQLVPNISTVHNRAIIEIHRGCTRGCRFCQAGAITRPIRERPVDEIVASAEAVVQQTGYEELALLSLSSADYTGIDTLIRGLIDQFEGRHVSISLPSLRIDSFSVELAEMLSGGRHSGFTFAPEAGSDAMRRRINKDISTEALLSVAEEVFMRGWRTIKLYFMIGLPAETDEDMETIIDLSQEVRRIGNRIGGRKTEVHVSVSTFVPKPDTVFQWEPLVDEETVERRQQILKQGIRGRGLKLSWNAYPVTKLEALLTRGDRRLGALVERAWRLGARFDAWDEWCDPDAWSQAIAELPSEELRAAFPSAQALLDHQLYRRRQPDERLPWDHLQTGVEKRFLVRDYRRSLSGELLTDCREECHACGILQHYRDLQTEEWRCPVLT